MLDAAEHADLVEAFWNCMEQTGADFTNTFRDLAGVTKSQEMTAKDEQILAKLVTNCAPKEEAMSKCKIPYEDQPQVKMLLEKAPQMLRLYGHDPDVMIAQIRAAEARKAEVEANFESIKAGYKDAWSAWIQKYKAVLSQQSQTDE